jgi:hypothetical protein
LLAAQGWSRSAIAGRLVKLARRGVAELDTHPVLSRAALSLRIVLAAALAGALVLSAAAATPAGAKSPRRTALPHPLWALQLDGSGSVSAATLKRYRAQGFTAVLTRSGRVSARRLGSMRRGASRAGLLFLGSRSARRGLCAALRRQHKRCVLAAPTRAAALRLARSNTADLVVVRLRNVAELKTLGGRSRGRILALARLDGRLYDAAAWSDAVETAAADPQLDLGVIAVGRRRTVAASRFGTALRAHNVVPGALYVAPAGSDSNPCSAAAPCRSFQRAYNLVPAGGVIEVMPGTYPRGRGDIRGSKAATFHGQPGNEVHGINSGADNVTFDGLNATANDGPRNLAFLNSGADNVTFKNGRIGDAIDDKGAIIWGSNLTFNNVVFHDVIQKGDSVHNECIQATGPQDRFVLRNSTFRNCATMDLSWGHPNSPPATGVVIEGNRFFHSVCEGCNYRHRNWHVYGLALWDNDAAPDPNHGSMTSSWVIRKNGFENNVMNRIAEAGKICGNYELNGERNVMPARWKRAC